MRWLTFHQIWPLLSNGSKNEATHGVGAWRGQHRGRGGARGKEPAQGVASSDLAWVEPRLGPQLLNCKRKRGMEKRYGGKGARFALLSATFSLPHFFLLFVSRELEE